MAEIRVEKLHKAFGDFIAVRESDFTVADGEFFVMLGPSGCGKTTTLRMIAGLELPTSGRILLGGEDVTFNRAAARDIAFVFQLFALYPHMNVRQNIGFPLKCQGMPRAEIRAAGRGDGAVPAHRPPARPAGVAAGRRRPPARRARPRHRPPAQGLPDGRAARHPRHRVPRPDGARAARTAHAHRRDHGLRHPRPARGDVDGRQDRGDEPRRHRAVRHAAGDLRPAGDHVRRRFHRLAADELPHLPRQRRSRARRRSRINGADGRGPGAARGSRPRASSPSASGRSISASTTPRSCAARSSAPNISAPPRSSRSIPPTARSRRGCPPTSGPRPARRSGWRCAPSGCRCSTRRPAARSARALHEGAAPWLRSCSPRVTKRFGTVDRRRRSRPHHRRRRVRRAARPDRRRQDDDAAPGRRARTRRRGLDHASAATT